MASRTSSEAWISRPCSSQVYQVVPTPTAPPPPPGAAPARDASPHVASLPAPGQCVPAVFAESCQAPFAVELLVPPCPTPSWWSHYQYKDALFAGIAGERYWSRHQRPGDRSETVKEACHIHIETPTQAVVRARACSPVAHLWFGLSWNQGSDCDDTAPPDDRCSPRPRWPTPLVMSAR